MISSHIALRGDAIHQQHGAINARHSRLRTCGKIRSTNRPIAIAETNAAVAILQSLLTERNGQLIDEIFYLLGAVNDQRSNRERAA